MAHIAHPKPHDRGQTPAVDSVTQAGQRARNLSALGLILLSVVLAGSGQLIFKAAMNSLGELELTLPGLVALVTSPLLLVGLAVFFVSALLWLVALLRADLSFAVPFLSLSYVIVLTGSYTLFHEHIGPLRLVGFALIVLGLFVVARGERRPQGQTPPEDAGRS
jgi:drug/metabolite transporter (DMT)-like permease